MKDPLDFPGADRFLELYKNNVSFNEMANDPELGKHLLAGITNERTRSWTLYYKEKELVAAGSLQKRPRKFNRRQDAPSTALTLTESSPQEQIDRWTEYLQEYEELINSPEIRKEKARRKRARSEEIIVISDLHVPDERPDLLAQICREHAGKGLVIAGDLDDFEMLSRYDHNDWNTPTLQESLTRRDAVLDVLTQHFAWTRVLLGNHDLRLPRRAAKALGPDYAWISQQFLMWAYEKRHGIQVVTHDVRKISGRQIPYLHYYDQIGDCMIGHVEVAGRPVGSGASRAHDFFQQWKKPLGLDPFNVVLQAHTHKHSYFRHSTTGVHCFEIGALCDIPSYSLTGRQHYGPPQTGYFHLVQIDGVTQINESRLVVLD